MTQSKIRSAAQALLAARRDGAISELPADLQPRNVSDAYAIQDEVAHALGRIGGWKVGAASERAEPNCAPIMADRLFDSTHTVPRTESHMRGVEAEIAFRFGMDLPADDSAYSLGDLTTGIAAAMPVIETCESRFLDIGKVGTLSLLADSNSNSGLVMGVPWSNWPSLDVHQQPVRLSIGGTVATEHRGGNSAGEPMRLLVWLANHLAERGIGISKGDVVTTGSWTGLRNADPGDEVVAEFAGIGSVSVRFAQ